MKLKTTVLALSTLLTINIVQAASIKEQVHETVKKYALTTACLTTFEESEGNNFGKPDTQKYPLSYTATDQIYSGVNSYNDHVYYVIWGGVDSCDIAATGGNYTFNLTEVEYKETAERYLVIKKNILESVEGEDFFSLGNIDSFKQIDTTTFEVYLYMYSKNDTQPNSIFLKPNSEPKYYRMILIRDDNGLFKVKEKYKIG
ncbi:hypothetical protein [Acinetobacter terrae]|uniref:Uncharacterized protein n=1 Tax=Acinetobacter terrae TaxID=2731247 RepID=A0A4R0EG60_9GAMM|nr:hypothetical protein [Acinetobacter terrae]TCB55560.1 hypothetical protein E0H85_14850 [Acinetobacter terrae]